NVVPSKKSESRLIDNLRTYLNTHSTTNSRWLCRNMNMKIGGWFRYFSISNVSYPYTSAARVEEYLGYKLHKMFKRKSQRKSRICNRGVYKTLVNDYGLIKVTKWVKLGATVNA
ncbi:hypothetical protein HNV09_024600, partial [Oceanispirochaeta sp. M2]|nr:hypothetical protein [Oceanispirochaeta sp. M2]NPD75286.1 hypothetical protein [Oceanispirochaeta sp. M1]